MMYLCLLEFINELFGLMKHLYKNTPKPNLLILSDQQSETQRYQSLLSGKSSQLRGHGMFHISAALGGKKQQTLKR